MAGAKLTFYGLPALADMPLAADLIPIWKTSTGVTKKITITELLQIISPATYTSTMIGNETFTPAHTLQQSGKYILDANGSERNFNPTGTFLAGFEAKMINKGSENIIFDSSGLAEVVVPGSVSVFIFDGTDWLRMI